MISLVRRREHSYSLPLSGEGKNSTALRTRIYRADFVSLVLRSQRLLPNISTAAQFFLALDDLGREPQVSFAADAFEIIDQHRFTV